MSAIPNATHNHQLPCLESLWIDAAGRFWLVKEAGRSNVWAKCQGIKRCFGLGAWLEEMQPVTDDILETLMEVCCE